MTVAPVQEIFSSTQGEGVFVGKRQIFVRFAHCHLKCAYCDTTMTSPTGKCHLEIVPGSGEVELLESPMTPESLLAAMDRLLLQAKHHSISFTGGEPLLYHSFLKELLPEVQHKRSLVYLETSATQPHFLEPIMPWVDVIAMDIKLPSATQEPPEFENHKAFYQLAETQAHIQMFIKVIFSPKTTLEELDAVKEIVSDRDCPIILQPMMTVPVGPESALSTVSPADIFRVENYLSHTFNDVRVIPQTHKLLNVL